VLAPWAALALVGGVATAVDRGLRRRCGPEVLACAVIVVADVLMLSSLVPYMSRNGWSVGPRYMTVVMPFVGWLAVIGIQVASRNRVAKLLALSAVVTSVAIFVLGSTTFPHWPDRIRNPLYELVFPLLKRGYAVHSLGTAVGLWGIYAILPLYLFAFAAMAWFLGLVRRRVLPVLALVCGLAALTLTSYRAFPKTDPSQVNPWPLIDSIWEPMRR
jgi:hypothetical protein